MVRKGLCLLLVMLLGVLVMPAEASSGAIRVDIGGEGEVTLYRVGILEREHYRLSDEHGGGTVTFDDILLPELAAWLAQRSQGGISRETEQGIAEFTGLSEGLYLAVQTREGENDTRFAPFLISLPWDGDTWILDVRPQMTLPLADTPQTGDRGLLVWSSLFMAGSMIGLLVIGSRKKY